MKCKYRHCDNDVINNAQLGPKKHFCSNGCLVSEAEESYIEKHDQGRIVHGSSYPISARVFGNALLKEGKITQYQFEKALELKSMNGRRPLAYYLLKKGWVERRDVLTALARIHRVPYIVLGNRPQAMLLASKFPFKLLLLAGAVPFSFNRPVNKLCFAMKDPSNLSAVDAFKAISGNNIQVFQGDPLEIDQYLKTIKANSMLSTILAGQQEPQQLAV